MMKIERNAPGFLYEHQLIKKLYEADEFHMPVRYIWMLSNECNLRCPFCFMEHSQPGAAMTTDDWLDVLSQLPEYARVVLMGGEPLFYKGFKEVYERVSERFRCTVATNGTLLDETMVDLLLSGKNLYELSVSIEMVGNPNRGFTSSQWSRLVQGMTQFARKRKGRKNQPRLGVTTIFLDENADQLFDLYRFCREDLHCDNVTYNPLNGTPMQLADRMLPFERLQDDTRCKGIFYDKWEIIKGQLEKIRDYDREHGIHSTYIRPKLTDFGAGQPLDPLDVLNHSRIDDTNFGPCKYPWSDCRIYGDGNISSCLAYSFGNFKELRDLKAILAGEKAERFRRTLRRMRFYPQCFRCVFQYDKKFEV